MSDSTMQMSVHDQLLILDKVADILSEIEYYSEDQCPPIFNELFNKLSSISDDLQAEVRFTISESLGNVFENGDYESIKNSLLS